MRQQRRLLVAALLVLGVSSTMAVFQESDSECVGVQVSGGGSALEDAVKAQGPGTTFCIAEGTYTVSSAGLTMQTGDTLDGEGIADPLNGVRPVVEVATSSAVQVLKSGTGVTLKDVSVSGGRDVSTALCDSATINCGRGAKPGPRWTILRSRFHHNDSQGIGSPGEALLLNNVELDNNGLKWDGPDNNGFAAGIKGGPAGGFTVRNSYVHDNNQGVWCDVDCKNTDMEFVVTGNRIIDNCSFGIHYEFTYNKKSTPASATITDNVVRGNDWCNLTRKSDIGIISAENAVVARNVVGPSAAHPRLETGINFVDRGKGPSTGSATDNELNGDTLVGCGPKVLCTGNSL